ncbi:AP-5 complex subunit sigma-1-like [Saccostrea cucullata]|uniref:AP-5 complex subunit sigma-1-like n=1 Tax=Saccostrea cuccullata TaxID=36930 RepID=UPI002ECFB218
MVYAFVIHTLLPGPCRVLYHNVYGQDVTYTEEIDDTTHKNRRRDDIQLIANEVHSEYQFRKAVLSRTVEDDIQRMGNDDTLPEFEFGCVRLPEGNPFVVERIALWLGAGNTGFTLVCEKSENRLLAENVLKILIRFIQEHVRVLNQPSEARMKSDKIALILSRFLPNGHLLFMNHRVVRQLEKEVESLMKLS